jgi:hypothetical protein
LLRAHAAFWDEYQYLRFPGLDSHLVLVAEHNQTEGQAAIELLSMGRQRWAAQAAQIELDARWLQRHSEVESMREAHRGLAVGDLAGPASALLRSFNRISQDVDAALAQESAYNQRLALRAVEERLDGLVRELTRSDEPYAVRFSPIAAMWRQGVASAGRRLAEAVEQRQEIDNPYVIGVPLTTDQAIFVGRSDVSARIEQLLLDRRRPPLLLYGQRRMGKTSLLNNLGRLLPSTVIPLFVDLQGPTARASDDAGLLYNLARAVAASAHTQRAIALPALAREQLAGDPFTCFDEWLDLVEQTLGSHMALLMLDEFETLEYGFNTGRFTGELVLGMFRHMIQHRPRFKILLAGSHRIEEMQRWASYLINVQVVQLSYLYPGEARQLIERPTPDFVLCYDPDARERVMALTRCHPFLLQLLCSEVVAVKNEQPAADRRHATLADVEIAAREALHHGSLFFTDIEHNQVDEVGTIILRRLAAHGEGAVAPLAVLADALLEGRVNAALERLLQRDLVEQSGGSYRFQVELVRRWFASLDRLRSGKAAGPPDWPVG